MRRFSDSWWRVSRRGARLLFAAPLASLISGCAVGGWSPQIGDPTFVGWFTAAFYFVAAYLCFACVHVEKAGPKRPLLPTLAALIRVTKKHWPNPPGPARRSTIWAALGVAYVFLGVNKQLDLQTLLTSLGRMNAEAFGWYEQRRLFQFVFVLLIGALGVIAARLLLRLARHEGAVFILPFLGFCLTVTFVLVRASSFHAIDQLINYEVLSVRMNGVLENAGIALVAFGAWSRLSASRSRR